MMLAIEALVPTSYVSWSYSFLRELSPDLPPSPPSPPLPPWSGKSVRERGEGGGWVARERREKIQPSDLGEAQTQRPLLASAMKNTLHWALTVSPPTIRERWLPWLVPLPSNSCPPPPPPPRPGPPGGGGGGAQTWARRSRSEEQREEAGRKSRSEEQRAG
jgi:hypothetical protein